MNFSRALAARRSHVPRPLGDLRLSAWPEIRVHLQTWTTAGGPFVPAGAPGAPVAGITNVDRSRQVQVSAKVMF
jgi:hypothetical protein